MENTSTSLSTKKRSVGVIIYSVIGFLIGIYATYKVSYHKVSFSPYWFIGPTFILLSFGIFIMRNWARIAIIGVSVFYILLNIFDIFMPIIRPVFSGGWNLILLMILSPVLFLSIYSLVYLTRPKVKEQFK